MQGSSKVLFRNGELEWDKKGVMTRWVYQIMFVAVLKH